MSEPTEREWLEGLRPEDRDDAPARSPVDDALDRLARGPVDPAPFVATVRERLDTLTAQVEQLTRERSFERHEHQKTERRAEAAEAEVERLREERDAARRIAPGVRLVLEKALRRDMTKPPVTRGELQFALDLLPEPPSFRSSVDGMEALQAAEAELVRYREGLRDGAEAEEHLAARARSDVDYEGAAIHSHAASMFRALLSASPDGANTEGGEA